ncbi:phenylacetate--CoA ligase family protein [Tessaracoccus sp.]
MTTLKELSFRTKSRALAPTSYSSWQEMLEHDSWDSDQIVALRDKRRLEIARFAAQHSPFYTEFYGDHGVRPEHLRDPEVFDSLPFLTKDHVREHFDRIKTAEATPRTAVQSVSSGSTGHPLTVLSDRRAPVRAYEWRAMDWWGVKPWENAATIDRSWRRGLRKLQHRFFWWPTRRSLFHTLSLEPETLELFMDTWRRDLPQYVVGFIGGISQVGRYAADQGITLAAPKAVAVTAGPLLDGHRLEMETVFGCPVYTVYRSTESNWLAGECAEKNGLHIYEDIKHLEIIRPDGSSCDIGEEGETVFTDFSNRVFPLVRYRIGDRSRHLEGPCPCGRPYRRVAGIQGRVVDALVMPSGRILTGDIFDYFEGCAQSLHQWQIHQSADHSVEVTVRLTAQPHARTEVEERVARLRAHVHGEVPVSMRVVDELVPVRGKFRPITSDVPQPPSGVADVPGKD